MFDITTSVGEVGLGFYRPRLTMVYCDGGSGLCAGLTYDDMGWSDYILQTGDLLRSTEYSVSIT